MKKIIIASAFALGICFFGALATHAQDTKIGYISSMELLNAMPEFKTAQSDLEAYATKLQQDLEAKDRQLRQDAEAFMQSRDKIAPIEADKKMKELQLRDETLQKENQNARLEISKKEETLIAPIRQKALDNIKLVAQENGYTYIMDSGVGVALFSLPSDNILSLVKKKMGIQ